MPADGLASAEGAPSAAGSAEHPGLPLVCMPQGTPTACPPGLQVGVRPDDCVGQVGILDVVPLLLQKRGQAADVCPLKQRSCSYG